MITRTEFDAAISTYTANAPMAKPTTPASRELLWRLLPADVRQALHHTHLQYALMQRLLDPAPAEQRAVSVQLMRYLFPLRDDMPFYGRGLRADLAQRMADPTVFHDLAARSEAASPPALPPAEAPMLSPAGGGGETQEQRLQRLEALARATLPPDYLARWWPPSGFPTRPRPPEWFNNESDTEQP